MWQYLKISPFLHITCRFNEKAFGNRLPAALEVTWNAHLKTTAGLTYYEKKLVDGADEPRHVSLAHIIICLCVFPASLPPLHTLTQDKLLDSSSSELPFSMLVGTYSIYSRYSARIELSTKVVDSVDRLQRTLLHELCHAAAWLIDHVAKPPHGTHFKYWAGR